jgi:magnesium-transporting ATPase (P-type)
MATLNETPDGRCIFLKGSPEAVLERCTRQLGPEGGEEELDADAAREVAGALADEGYRVLGMAIKYRDIEGSRARIPAPAWCSQVSRAWRIRSARKRSMPSRRRGRRASGWS